MKKTELKEFDNTSYQPGSMAKRSLWYVVNVLFFNTSVPFPNSLKRMLLRIFGAKIGMGVILKPKVNIKYPWMLGVGNHSWIGEGVWIDNLGHVEIGANCCLSQGVMLLCGNHNFSVSGFDLTVKEITLEEGVWLGAKSTVTQGVTCYSHSVLTVGSVASKNLEAYSINRGNPAEKIKSRVIE
ncbi:MAG: WcaF family extracellular polysaccharide biosynthesis acetyltransferase [Flavobacteriales bacterium]